MARSRPCARRWHVAGRISAYQESNGSGMNVVLVIHGTAGAALEALRQGARRLRGAGHRVGARVTFEAGDATRFAAEAMEEGADLVVACGGDGTINEVVNGLGAWAATAGAAGARMPRLGIVPLGTGNDFAGGLGIPVDVPRALDVALDGVPRPVDVGCVNGHRFVNVSSGGFGTAATEGAGGEAKRVLGPLAYAVRGVQELVELDAVAGRFTEGDTLLYEGEFLLFAVGNGPRTGGGNLLTPRADPSDGLLDLCIVPQMGRMEFVSLAPQLRTGRHTDRDDVVYRRVRELVVEADAPLRVNADGEPMEGTRFVYAIDPMRITVMVPGADAEGGAGEETAGTAEA
jgi:diacylglycerol kinase (ATP)